jgi:sulfur carrier protein
MPVTVNGETYLLPDPRTLAALLRAIAPTPPYAVARNEEFVPRAAYEECRLTSGDRIDIVHPTVGG